MQSTKCVALHSTCHGCGRHGFKPVADQPEPDDLDRMRRRERCSECGDRLDIELMWDSGWSEAFVKRWRDHFAALNEELKREKAPPA